MRVRHLGYDANYAGHVHVLVRFVVAIALAVLPGAFVPSARACDHRLRRSEARSGALRVPVAGCPASLGSRESSSPEPVIQTGHRAAVSMVAFAHGGEQLVTGSADGTVKVWNWRQDEVARTLRVGRGHAYSGTVLSVPALAPDGDILAVPQLSYRVDLWSLSTGRRIRRLDLPESARVHDEPPDSDIAPRVTWSPDGRTLAVYTWQELELWNAATGRLLRTLGRSSGSDVAFSTDGRLLARFSDGKVVLLDVATGKRLRVFKDIAAVSEPITFSPDGALLAAQGEDPHWSPPEHASSEAAYARNVPIVVWDVRTGKARRMGSYGSLNGGVVNLLFRDGKTLLCRQAGGLDVWDARSGKLLKDFPIRDFGGALALAPDGRSLAIAENAGVAIRALRDGRSIQELTGRNFGYVDEETTTLAFSSDGAWLAVGDHIQADSNFVRLWDLAHASLVASLGPIRDGSGMGGRARIWFAAAGGQVDARIAASTPVALFVWDRRTLAPVIQREYGRYFLSPDGATIVADSVFPLRRNPLVTLLDAATMETRATLENPPSEALVDLGWASFSPDGRRLASVISRPGKRRFNFAVRVWDMHSGKVVSSLDVPADGVMPTLVWWSSDGHTLFTLSAERTAILQWDADSGKLLNTTALSGSARTFTLAGEGKTLALADREGEIAFRDGASGRLLRTVQDADIPVSLALSSDGRRLATYDSDGATRIVSVATGRLIATLYVFQNDPNAAPSPDWLLITSEGYYDGSTGAERFLRWRVGFRLEPASAYSQEYHDPGRVRELLQRD